MTAREPAATLVVATHNRRDDLRRLLASAVAQTADLEILVLDDGSSDGTAEMVAAEFPAVRLERSETSLGYIAQRNRGAELARAPILVSADDDAELPSPATVAQTLRELDHPWVGAVAIPYVDVLHDPAVRQRAPDDAAVWVTSTFRGTAYAVRRDVFLRVGGFRPGLGRQVEEPDFCLRMLDAGWFVRLGRADPILHHEAPKPSVDAVFALDRRNNLLHGWHNVPMPYLPVRLAKETVATLLLARRHGHAGAMARGLAQGWAAGPRAWRDRAPVRRSTYRLDHAIRRRGMARLADLEAGR